MFKHSLRPFCSRKVTFVLASVSLSKLEMITTQSVVAAPHTRDSLNCDCTEI